MYIINAKVVQKPFKNIIHIATKFHKYCIFLSRLAYRCLSETIDLAQRLSRG